MTALVNIRNLRVLIRKFAVAWLIGLFAWNAALAGIPDLLLCLHSDYQLHGAMAKNCEDSPACCASTPSESNRTLASPSSDCTDLQLLGGELLPTRLNECLSLQLPLVTRLLAGITIPAQQLMLPSQTTHRFQTQPPMIWLTEVLLAKTVLRI